MALPDNKFCFVTRLQATELNYKKHVSPVTGREVTEGFDLGKGLTSAFEPVRTVITRLIQDHRYVRPRSDKLAITAFYHITMGLLCFYHY